MIPIAAATPASTGILSFGFLRSSPRIHIHNGIDLPSPRGTPVLAARSGVVTHARAAYEAGFSGYGGHVVIKHGTAGPWTLYAHLDTVAVSPGQFVQEGQKLGTVGNTRFTKEDPNAVFSGGGYHVHFEVSPKAYPLPSDAPRLDPRPFLGLSATPVVGAKAAGGGLITLLALGGGAWWWWKSRGRA